MRRLIIFLICILTCNISYSNKNIYVAPTGNDAYEGSINRPFRTIERALIEAANKKEASTVFIREGVYFLEKSLELTNINHITITAYPKETVYLTGGISIEKKYISNLIANNVSSRINYKYRNKVKTINFNEFGITISDLDKRGFEYSTKPAWNEVFINNEPLKIAQWPNNNMITTHKVINPGNNRSKGITGQGNPIIEYINEEPNNWKSVSGAWICGYFGEGWADDMLPIKSIDKENKTITIGASSLYGFKADGVYRRWFVRNLPEEIDQPGEYINNAATNEIYFLPPKENINKIQLSVLKDPIMQIKSCENVTIKNLTIECSRGMGILIDSSNNILVDSCTIRNIGNIGIKIGPNTYNNGIQNSYIYNTGSGGIELNGGSRKKLISGNNFVYNCRIHDFNRIEKAKRPAINLKGAGNKISKVDIYNAPSMGIYINGNNHTIEYVDISNVCTEAHDLGAIYTGRNPTERGHKISYSYFHDIQSPFEVTAIYHDDAACGMDVYGCIFNNISSAPIWLGGGQDINYYNNIFLNVPYVIQVDNRLQIWQSYAKWLKPGDEFEKKFEAVNYKNPPYSVAYPELLEYWENEPSIPKRNNIKNNIIYNIKNKLVKGKIKFLQWDKNYIETSHNEKLENIDIKSKIFSNHQSKIENFEIIPINQIGSDLPVINNLY